MIANVGKLIVKPILALTVDEWDDIFATSSRGMFICHKVAAAKMMALAGLQPGDPPN